MKKQKQEEPPKNIHLFKCDGCSSKEMSKGELITHMIDVHQLPPDKLKGTKQMLMHMDFTDSFSSTYQWTLESGLKFTEFIEMERAKDDMMRFMD